METSDSNLFTEFRDQFSDCGQVQGQAIISSSGCLAHQSNHCPQKPMDELENNDKVSFLGKTTATGKPWEVFRARGLEHGERR